MVLFQICHSGVQTATFDNLDLLYLFQSGQGLLLLDAFSSWQGPELLFIHTILASLSRSWSSWLAPF